MAQIMKYVNVFGGAVFGGAISVIGLFNLYEDEVLPAAPDSILLTVLILAGFGLLVTSIIGAIGMIQENEGDVVSEELVRQTMGYHHRISGRLVMLTGLYAGLSILGKEAECGDDKNEACDTLFSGTMSLGEGLFLGSLIYKGLDAVVDFFATLYAGDSGYKKMAGFSESGDKISRDYVGLASLILAFIFFMINHGLDEVFDKYTTEDDATTIAVFKNTSFAEEAGKVDRPLLNWAMILSIIVLAVFGVIVGFNAFMKESRIDNFMLAAVGSISSATTHVISGLLSIHVGKHLHAKAYEADDDFLPSNFFFFGAAVLASYAAINFDSKDVIEDDEDKTSKAGTLSVIGGWSLIFGSVGLWATQVLYQNINYVGKVNVTLTDDSIGELDAHIPSKARELGMYALFLVVFIALSGFAIKLLEVLIKTGGSIAGLFQGVKTTPEDRFATLRAEGVLTFALISAVLWGSKVDQGDAKALGDGTLTPLWILWFASLGGRVMGFILDQRDGDAKTLGELLYDTKITRIFTGEDGEAKITIPCLGAVISLILSFVCFTVYFYHGSDLDSWKFWGDDGYVAVFRGLSWILVLTHVVLTITGLIPGLPGPFGAVSLHAGVSPIVRFGVSTIAIWSFGIAAGEELLSTANEQYAFPAFVLYVAYEILSKGKF